MVDGVGTRKTNQKRLCALFLLSDENLERLSWMASDLQQKSVGETARKSDGTRAKRVNDPRLGSNFGNGIQT